MGTRQLIRLVGPALGVTILMALSQCEDSTAPSPPGTVTIISGDNQFSMRGTELPEPLVVAVKTVDGSVAKDVLVEFQVIEGQGALSRTSAMTDANGRTSTRLTLGQALGTVRVRASSGEGSVVFTATSGQFFCPEADDSLRVCGAGCSDSYGTSRHLFLATQKSGLFSSTSAGVVGIDPFNLEPTASSFTEIPLASGVFQAVIYDVAFSPRGDFYVAMAQPFAEVMKVSTAGVLSHFAFLDETSEITMNPYGLLIGCDSRGPFVIGCRDTLGRYSEASFATGSVNDDAVAVDPRRQDDDPLGEDVYFIHKGDQALYRLPLDSLHVEGSLQLAAMLSADQADFARGMVCADDGTVYVLVDATFTKELISVPPGGGSVSTVIDFFVTRGPDEAAGMQRDLAYDRPFIYTLDTLNDDLLVWDGADLKEIFTLAGADSLEHDKLSNRGTDGTLIGGERVGLGVLK